MKKFKYIVKHQRPVGILSKILNYIGSFFIYFLQKFDFSPNYFTFLSLVSSIIGSILIILNNFIFAFIAFIFWYIFDVMDGQWARLKGRSSLFGKLLDGITDRISLFILSLSLLYYVIHYGLSYYLIFLIFFFIGGLYLNYFINYLAIDIINFDKLATKDNKSNIKKESILIKIGKKTVTLFYHDKLLLVLLISLLINHIELFIFYLGINGLYLLIFSFGKMIFIYNTIKNEKK